MDKMSFCDLLQSVSLQVVQDNMILFCLIFEIMCIHLNTL
jgi:hypothetical protein